MTDQEPEIITLLHALGDAIRTKDWPGALTLWERLLRLHLPLADMQPALLPVLRNLAATVYPRSNSIN